MSSYENNIENLDKENIKILESDANFSDNQSQENTSLNNNKIESNKLSNSINSNNVQQKTQFSKDESCFKTKNSSYNNFNINTNKYYGNYGMKKKLFITWVMFKNKLLYYCSYIAMILIEKRFIKIADKYIRRFLKLNKKN